MNNNDNNNSNSSNNILQENSMTGSRIKDTNTNHGTRRVTGLSEVQIMWPHK